MTLTDGSQAVSVCDAQRDQRYMKHTIRTILPLLTLTATLLAPGCRSFLIDRTDGFVYDAVHDRQQAVLGETSNMIVGDETGDVGLTKRMYSFNPRPVDPELPKAFETSKPHDDDRPPMETDGADHAEADSHDEQSDRTVEPADALEADSDDADEEPLLTKDIFSEKDRVNAMVFGLRDAMKYALHHARDLQDAKEALYLAALDLTLERHLWTPQFVASIRADFADFGQVRDFDRAMTTVSDVAVSQRLRYGGTVTAQVISSLMRDLGVSTTSGESGSAILSADIPLLRGAGEVAYESRYVAERDLIYAVRTYERFRRTFLVAVASRYFNLQGLKSAIANSHVSYLNFRDLWIRSDFINRMGQSRNVFEAPRARSSFRRAESALVSAKERYATSLDQFKIFIGMEVVGLMEVASQGEDKDAAELDNMLPDVALTEATAVALRYRLDYINVADRLDDTRRGVTITKNAILPDLTANLSATVASDPERFSSTSFNLERTTWRGAFELRMDDRKRERTAYRASLISVRRATRDYELAGDRVLADVRRALRRVLQQENIRDIQIMQVNENVTRAEAARAQFDLGMSTNQDVVDAENELLAARNDLANAISAYRIAILEYRRDTGTLRVSDDGRWGRNDSTESHPTPTDP